MDAILTLLCESDPDNFYDELAVKLEAAWEKANEMLTPWFIGAYVMDTCKEEIEEMAKNAVSEIIYKTEPGQEIPDFVDISE